MVAVVEDDVVFLRMTVMAVEDTSGGQAEGFEIGADQLRGDDLGGGEIDERNLPAVATLTGVFSLIRMGRFGMECFVLGQEKPLGRN